MFISILTFIIILAILVLAHEWGHFYFARKNGMHVEEFGIGFPPRIFSFKKNGVLYTINWLPLGGFVKIKGESGQNVEDEDSFAHKNKWKRFQVLFAGVFMNVIVAWVLFMVGFMIGFPQVVNENTSSSANIKNDYVQVVSVLENSPAALANVELGDQILSINGEEIKKITVFSDYIHEHEGETVSLMIERQGETISKHIEPILLEETGRAGIGVGLIHAGTISYPIHHAIWEGTKFTIDLTGRIVGAFYNLFKDLVVSQSVDMNVSGPIGIAVLTGRVAELGFIYILQFMALLSLNLAIINLLPIPALDGGRILFLIIETIRRKPMHQKTEGIINQVGFLFLMGIIVIITYHDIRIHGGEFWNSIKSIF